MATASFKTIVQENARLYKDSSNYYTAHDATWGTVTPAYNVYIGQRFYSNVYYMHRGAVSFDTSGISADSLIISAYLKCYTVSMSNNNVPVVIKNGQPTYPSVNPVEVDYNIANYSGNGGEGVISNVNLAISYIYFNDIGISWINRGGYTKLLIVGEGDNDRTPPTGDEYQGISTAFPGGAYTDMLLVIEYFLPTEVPTVITIDDECEDRQSTTLTAVGEITGTGDGYTFRGFEYYQYTEEGEYDSSMWAVREIGRFHTLGEFRMTLYGLKPLTCYWIRAFAGNVFGIGYGEWVICCTIAGSPSTYDVYTEPNTARYRLYVSDDEAIAWRGYKGPYSGKQQNINISDITNKTKGIKVLKIDLPDANTKGNFHVCITVKQELKG